LSDVQRILFLLPLGTQGLKIFEGKNGGAVVDTDFSKFEVHSSTGIKRTVRRFGKASRIGPLVPVSATFAY
jgi:hypothetical protein